MKKIINTNIALLLMLVISLAFAFSSCEKDSDGSPDVKAGTPVFESVTPASASGGTLVTVKGTGLGDIRAVIFSKESVPAYLMSTLNTETALLFRVPADAAGGSQNIILVNSKNDTLKVPFNVLAFPQLVAVNNYNFVAGDQITITGTNLNDVINVKLTGTSDMATIVSKEKKKLVITMPATAAKNATLDVTNITGLTTSTFELVCLTNIFVCYTDAWGAGAYNSGVQSWSWGCSVSETSDVFMTGTKSLKVSYTDGGLSMFLGSDWADPIHVFTDWYTPTYFAFWAKGDGKAADLVIISDSPPWDGSFPTGTFKVTVPADVWTYVKVPASTWAPRYGRLNIKCSGTQSVFFDDLIYI
jgi:hypothetical protein